MILTDSEKILVALGALVIILAIVANAVKDYKRMTREANKKVEQNNIQILFSTGGYMSIPLCISAILLKRKIYLFEPNMVVGRSNKLFLKFSEKIICYSKSLKNFPTEYKNKIYVIKPLLREKIYGFLKFYIIWGLCMMHQFFPQKEKMEDLLVFQQANRVLFMINLLKSKNFQ